LGSLLMLAAIIGLYYLHATATGGAGTFDYVTLLNTLKSGQMPFSHTTGTLIFWAFALAFMIKVPVFPFHTWLPDAHTEAPTAGSVILSC
jgi:NADH-quinone oxidoreductase subunit M